LSYKIPLQKEIVVKITTTKNKILTLPLGNPAAPSGCQFASVWAGKNTSYGPWSPAGYRQWIDDHVQGVIKLGMIAIVDLHWSDMDGTACCDNGANSCYAGCQQTMADHKSVYFWQYVATKYCNQSNIWFELYNEPAYGLNNGSNTTIPQLVSGGTVQVSYKNGCPASPLSTFTFVGLQDLYNSVRATAVCNNIVVAGGADWSWSWHGVLAAPRQPNPNVSWCWDQLCQYGCGIHNGVDYMIGESSRGEGYPAPVPWSTRRWGLNVVYNTHPYQQKGGQTPSQGEACSNWVEQAINGSQPTQICSEQCGWYTAFGFLTQYVPVIATEMGPWQGFSCDGSYITCQLEWFNELGISCTPWAYWGNNAAQCNGYPTLVNPNWTNNGYGNAVQQFMTQSNPPYIVQFIILISKQTIR